MFLPRIAALAVAAAVVGLVATAPRALATEPRPGTCHDVAVPVSLTAGGQQDNTVAATVCTPTKWAVGEHRMDVLVAGATYNRLYWDWPQHPRTYSYVDATLAAGRATVDFDRLGTGASSRPPSGQLTVSSEAYALHQLVGWVRSHGYRQVEAVGHSLGSVTLTNEASRWHDLDRLVITGLVHMPGIGLTSPVFFVNLRPASLDPAFAGRVGDPGELTTAPGTRGLYFYDPATADPAVIAYDESHKDLTTVGEVGESLVSLVTPAAVNPTRSITAPVLVVMGSDDDIFCNIAVSCHSPAAIRANEAPYYSGAKSLDVLVAPGTAHDLTLHPSAPQTNRAISTWLTTGRLS